MSKFEKVSRFANVDISMPTRKTAQSAGYDFAIAEDIIIPSYANLMKNLVLERHRTFWDESDNPILSLEEISALTKSSKAKPTLVSTGMKCQLNSNEYLELSVRSSCPLKYWILLANGVGIIDADYWNNLDNEGEIFFQLINLSPYDIYLHKGEIIGQGIIKQYFVTEDDNATGQRTGGFGSTSK